MNTKVNLFATDENIEDLMLTRQANGPHLNPNNKTAFLEMPILAMYASKFAAAHSKHIQTSNSNLKLSELFGLLMELATRIL